MHFHRTPSWHIPERLATPESVFLNRRTLLKGLGFAGASALATAPSLSLAANAEDPFVPMPERTPGYADAGRPITDEAINASYNNFYEFGSSKRIANEAQALDTSGWEITIDGLVEAPMKVAVDDLLTEMPMEERVYRHRCVEAWSMTVPWIGFELSALLAKAKPLSGATYVQFQTFLDPDTAREQRATWWPWPYTEGLTIEEAQNELSFMVVGAYGKVLHKQFGAPIRLHTPWKYGFKAIKSIDRITFTDQQPVSFWEELQAREYGFWANVNPDVPHPRWSQATERVLGTDERIPTLLFNGYGQQVAGLYTGKEAELGERLWR